MNTGHGLAIAGLFIGMGLCMSKGAYFGAQWLLLLYLGGWVFWAYNSKESEDKQEAEKTDIQSN